MFLFSVDKYFGGDEEHYIAIVRDEADDTSRYSRTGYLACSSEPS
jgi:hypothetical protein